MFRASVIRCPIKLKVVEVARNVREVVEARAKKMLEGICSYVGYAKPGSLRLLQMGPGVLSGIDMGRHFTFQCTFAAEVCNPAPGTRMKAYVRSVNRFGALVEAGYIDHLGTLVAVIELVVIRDPTIAKNEVDVADLEPGDEVGVEVLGRRFELRDTRIAGFGRTVIDVGNVGDAGEEGPPLTGDVSGLPASGGETANADGDIAGSSPLSGQFGQRSRPGAGRSSGGGARGSSGSDAGVRDPGYKAVGGKAAGSAGPAPFEVIPAEVDSEAGSEGGSNVGSEAGSDAGKNGDSDEEFHGGVCTAEDDAAEDDADLRYWGGEDEELVLDEDQGQLGYGGHGNDGDGVDGDGVDGDGDGVDGDGVDGVDGVEGDGVDGDGVGGVSIGR